MGKGNNQKGNKEVKKPKKAKEKVEDLSKKLLTNLVIEDYKIIEPQ